MYKLEIYSSDQCNYCQMAKRILTHRGLVYEEYNIAHNPVLFDEMHQRANQRSVPQIFLNDEHIGGFDNLMDSINEGRFESLIDSA